MTKTILITGGAGFIGSHLADELLRHGHRVVAFDNLSPQVHGHNAVRPGYLDSEVELILGDIRDRDAVNRALRGIDVVFHLAARVGVGQSMYRIADYMSVNNVGTAVLLEAMLEHPVEKLVVASSMSIYGEGLYRCKDGTLLERMERSYEQMKCCRWEPVDIHGSPGVPLPTPENKPPSLASVYALSKYDQERMCLMAGRAYDLPTVALRFFNVFGTRQALSNPYTGVLAIFASRLLNGNPPMIFEDGEQMRDFVSVKDVANACLLAMNSDKADGRVLNIGSGTANTIREIAARMAAALGRNIEPEITGQYRAGDIRHCFADISAATEVLGYEPRAFLESELAELAEWVESQTASDNVADARGELIARGLAA